MAGEVRYKENDTASLWLWTLCFLLIKVFHKNIVMKGCKTSKEICFILMLVHLLRTKIAYSLVYPTKSAEKNPLQVLDKKTQNKILTTTIPQNPNFGESRRNYRSRDYASDFIEEISGIKIPYREVPKQLPFLDKIDDEEEDLYTRDVEESDYNNAYDYLNKPRPPAFNDYPVADGYPDVVSRYKVVEKIPDDTVYKPPKMKVVPIPAPCIRTPPLPRPNTPRPPSIKSYPMVNSFYFDDDSFFPIKQSNKNLSKPKTVKTYPFVIRRYLNPPQSPKNIIVREQKLPQKVIKEVHIHHHHPPIGIPLEMHIHKSKDKVPAEIMFGQKEHLERIFKDFKTNQFYDNRNTNK